MLSIVKREYPDEFLRGIANRLQTLPRPAAQRPARPAAGRLRQRVFLAIPCALGAGLLASHFTMYPLLFLLSWGRKHPADSSSQSGPAGRDHLVLALAALALVVSHGCSVVCICAGSRVP
jgi:hypothetical protein